MPIFLFLEAMKVQIIGKNIYFLQAMEVQIIGKIIIYRMLSTINNHCHYHYNNLADTSFTNQLDFY